MESFHSCCIIDDDEFFAFNAKRLIIESGFAENVLWYSDGQRAIDGLIGLLIENISLPQIILLDLNMPNKNGWEFLDEFEALPIKERENSQLFITSSFVSPDLIKKAKGYNLILEYIVKPLTKETLEKIATFQNKLD